MIVVDSSALIAILLNEPESAEFTAAVVAADGAQMAAPNFFEASMVAETRKGPAGCRDLDGLMVSLGLSVVAFDATHIEGARDAYRRYGKGRHRAALNFLDCCAFALARVLDWPLLFKGNDFALTGLKRAL